MILRTFRLGLVQQWFYRKVLKKCSNLVLYGVNTVYLMNIIQFCIKYNLDFDLKGRIICCLPSDMYVVKSDFGEKWYHCGNRNFFLFIRIHRQSSSVFAVNFSFM